MVKVIATSYPGDGHSYPLAVVLGFFSLLVVLLNLPPLVQHYRNRNIGATALVAGVILANFQNLLNAIIWPNDDYDNWFNGAGLCDIEVKLQMFRQVLFPASVACILRALANVMNTDRAAWISTTAQKKRQLVIDLLCVVGAPSLQMILHIIVQPLRYYLYGIIGCQAVTDGSWLAFLLLLLPPLLWTVVDAYYAILIVVRLIRYRLTFNTILANSSTNKSRFVRLYLLATVWVLGTLPVEAFTLYMNDIGHLLPFQWSMTHPSFELWNTAMYVPSHGKIVFADRIIYVAGGFVIFLLFGWGKDAVKLYRDALLALGFGKIFPSLRPDYERHGSFAATVSTISSKAKMMFHKNKKESWSPTSTNFSATESMGTASTPSPKQMAFLDSIRENRREDHQLDSTAASAGKETKPSCPFCRFTPLFRGKKKTQQHDNYHHGEDSPFALGTLSTSPSNLNTTVSAEPISLTSNHARSKSDVVVRTEVRQASETADTIAAGVEAARIYEGV
ncbi:Pheromone a factor receptor [Lecanosticta acicola]|uniref:Pheromone a factor receptor n=1 Tax=Lecanosticta acicola TaxID=111012 RepID=A0AAI9EAK7_9PEZI|nr:Pheromone a factor receptor [Lecanosticta acicola]